MRRRMMMITTKKQNYLCLTSIRNSTVSLNCVGVNPHIEYNKNDEGWIVWDYSAISMQRDDRICFRGDNKNGFSKSRNEYATFILTGSIMADGNVNSLMFYDKEDGVLTPFCYYKLFYNQNRLNTPPQLPATTLASSCYEDMFWGCTTLTTVPELPATTLASSCYHLMFYRCQNFVTAPELPATTLASNCYDSMFRECTRLKTAPELPATTLAISCYYYMFYGCTGLTKAPELPATTLASRCYESMFRGCATLNYIAVKFTDWMDDYLATNQWLNGVSTNGTFEKPTNLAATRGVTYIPDGWTIINN